MFCVIGGEMRRRLFPAEVCSHEKRGAGAITKVILARLPSSA
jgi:hypothetical protein